MIYLILTMAFLVGGAVGEPCAQLQDKELRNVLQSNKVRTVSSTQVNGRTFPLPCNGHFVKPPTDSVPGAFYLSLGRHCLDEKTGQLELKTGEQSKSISLGREDYVFHYDKKYSPSTVFQAGDKSSGDRAIVMIIPQVVKKHEEFFKGVTSVPRCSDDVQKKILSEKKSVISSGTTNAPFDGKDTTCRVVNARAIDTAEAAKDNPAFFRGFYQFGFFGKEGAVSGLCKGDSGSPIYYKDEKGNICSFGSFYSNSMDIVTEPGKSPRREAAGVAPDYSVTRCGSKGQFSFYTEQEFVKKMEETHRKYKRERDPQKPGMNTDHIK